MRLEIGLKLRIRKCRKTSAKVVASVQCYLVSGTGKNAFGHSTLDCVQCQYVSGNRGLEWQAPA